MTKLVSTFLLAAATITAPALAETAAQPIAFVRDGIHYVGTVTDRADGTRRISGHEIESNRAFDLTVEKGMVTGTYDRETVSYVAPRTRLAKPAREANVATVATIGM